jgi:hypothetical protein
MSLSETTEKVSAHGLVAFEQQRTSPDGDLIENDPKQPSLIWSRVIIMFWLQKLPRPPSRRRA